MWLRVASLIVLKKQIKAQERTRNLMSKKLRIQYKNICITYNNCFEVELKDFKAFFIDLFEKHYKNKLLYLFITVNKKEKNTKVLLVLEKKPNFKTIDKFIYSNYEPNFNICNSPTTFIEEIKDEKNNKWIDNGDLENFKKINVRPSYYESEKEEWEIFIPFLKNLETEFEMNKEMVKEDAIKRIDEFLSNDNMRIAYKAIAKIEKIKNTKFIRLENPLKHFKLFPIETFKTNNDDLINIMKIIDEQLKIVKIKGNQHRPKALIIEGDTRIGKTQFILSYLNSKEIEFNLMKKDFDFTYQNYGDDRLVDVCDDINMFKVREKDVIESMLACAQASVKIENPGKWHERRTLIKNHFSIFLCNAHTSFEKYIEKMKNEDTKNYLFDNLIFHKINNKQKLYKDLKEEQKIKNLAIEMFGQNKIDFMD
ncbi:hypothetical protein C6B37_01345 [Candidatus Phytoplasma phoenicium]|uniref:Uncharacterized protein n=1 Tax=Candidatus Phytoplasma phoenicium TaxID=198422 RepID=A0A2S8NUU1_9MOLU|nr:hypothetical protein C6B37_01345 [Candidatus Phytoplasma phoenicium]